MRISVSDLQCYQRYRDNEEVTLQECLDQLLRKSLPTPAMMAGRALHAALEHAQYDDEALKIERDGYRFIFQCDVELAVPEVRELKGEIEMFTPSGPVTLVGVVDGIDNAVHDYKLTGRFDAERLADSFQWRCYLQMFNRDRFVYRVFVGSETAPQQWVIREYHEVPMYRYPNMEADIQKEVDECAAFMAKYVLKLKAA